jgi:hypothetical protein
MQFTINLTAGVRVRQETAGALFVIKSASAPVDVWLYDGSRELEVVRSVKAGTKARVPGRFSAVDLRCDVGAVVEFVISDGLVDFDFVTGTTVKVAADTPLPVSNDRGGAPGTPLYVSGLTLSDTPAVTLQDDAAVAIGPAAALIVAANAARKALRIANIGTDPMTIGAAGITWAKRCIVLDPGDVWVEERGANLAWYGITDAGLSASATAQEVIA